MSLTDDFKARFPEFAPATVDTYMPILEPVWPSYCNRPYSSALDKEVILNLLAHLLTGEVSAGSEGAQIQTSRSVGSVSVGFAAPSTPSGARDDFLVGTKYGQRYRMLTARNYGGVAV